MNVMAYLAKSVVGCDSEISRNRFTGTPLTVHLLIIDSTALRLRRRPALLAPEPSSSWAVACSALGPDPLAVHVRAACSDSQCKRYASSISATSRPPDNIHKYRHRSKQVHKGR
eukprot:COSAG02_NODE_1816_length_10778_cov_4.675812_4_plen_114_part_00